MGESRDHILPYRTPKCNPDIVGEVIEYYLVFENIYYRKLSSDKKKD